MRPRPLPLVVGPLAATFLFIVVSCGGVGPTSPGTMSPSTGGPPPEPADAAGGGRVPLGVSIGTQPPLLGAFDDADAFPVGDIITVLARDAIPALTDPRMSGPDTPSYLAEDDLVLGVEIAGDARAYPHNIGWWHEIVNDVVGGRPICVTFCPLTGTGLVFDGRDDDGTRRTLGVSGLLYNTNLVMYDRGDGSTLYPQIYGTGVRGAGTGRSLTLLPVVETTWRTWKRLHPETRVVAGGTYGASQYTRYPYGDYRTNDEAFLFAVNPRLRDNPNPQAGQIDAKDLVLGLRVDGQTRAYPTASLGARGVLNDALGGLEILVLHDREASLTVPFSRRLADHLLTFEALDEGGDSGDPFIVRDRETGTTWDALGRGLAGPLAGQRLTQLPAHLSMWFAWVTFWPATEVWEPTP